MDMKSNTDGEAAMDIELDGKENETTTRTGRCSCIPDWYWNEVRELFTLAWSMALYVLSFLLMAPISLIFAGQLGTVYLDGVGLANTVLNVTGIMIGAGLSTACDTLISQAYGSANKKKAGIYLQRGLIIILLCVLPCWAIHLNTEHILVAMGQDREIARIAGRYALIFMPALPAHFSYSILNKFLRNQNVVRPTMFIGFAGLAVNALFQYLLVWELKMGIEGSALAQVLGFWTLASLTIGYIVVSKVYVATWDGWSMEAFQEWGYFLKLAIAGLLMVTLQFWAFELGTLLSGIIGPVQLGAQAIIFQMESLTYTLGGAIGISCNIRVGQLLGANRYDQARKAVFTGFTLAWALATFTITILLSLKDYLPRLFSTDSDVIYLASTLLPILALYHLFDTTACVSTGIMRGCARQNVAAMIVFLGMYILGLPIGISMMFLTDLKTAGFWWGMTIALSVEGITYIIVIYKTNWERQAKLAQIRVGAFKIGKRSNTIRHDDNSIMEGAESGEFGSTCSTERTALIDHDQDVPKSQIRKRSYCGEVASSQIDITLVNAMPEVLTPSQLLFRRSLFILFMFSILCLGIFTRFHFEIPREMDDLCIPYVPDNATLVNSTVIIGGNTTFPLCTNSTQH